MSERLTDKELEESLKNVWKGKLCGEEKRLAAHVAALQEEIDYWAMMFHKARERYEKAEDERDAVSAERDKLIDALQGIFNAKEEAANLARSSNPIRLDFTIIQNAEEKARSVLKELFKEE